MRADLAGKTAIVTGAASGIGRAAVAAFMHRGANVAALDADRQGLERLDELEIGDQLTTHRVDVRERDELQDAVDRAEGRFGSVDILCTCAAIDSPVPVLGIAEDDWCRTMGVNAFGTVLAVQCVAPAMKRAGGGAIVTWGSVAAFRAEAHLATYCASKAAVVMLTKVIAVELAGDNIRANCVCPGMVDTAMASRYLPQSGPERAAYLQEMRSWQPLGLGTPEQLANVAAFLASDESAFMTGSAVMADGGFTSL